MVRFQVMYGETARRMSGSLRIDPFSTLAGPSVFDVLYRPTGQSSWSLLRCSDHTQISNVHDESIVYYNTLSLRNELVSHDSRFNVERGSYLPTQKMPPYDGMEVVLTSNFLLNMHLS